LGPFHLVVKLFGKPPLREVEPLHLDRFLLFSVPRTNCIFQISNRLPRDV
jgi:hypothetical protein